ncbi:hypothetical protein [Paucibacter sp. DJ2R-2]|uniref:hypothetical protein n=1 Tax=Paucibacter sp. DJ2R-2 TaxID=2893558 RepID=UPI0021E3FED0|nr:hypothetical protein [Paucibacter sp. DJ2R-2]MCV2419154.1 hypothetical protein [Paucibacter sp. DJ4R-1]MCV2437891.1 hypothetical protein [Paucibacter sp. DJ2R-2]
MNLHDTNSKHRPAFAQRPIATAATCLLISIASLGLSACGGGGGGDSSVVTPLPVPVPEPVKLIAPPTKAATLAQSGEAAQDSVKATTAAAADLVRRSNDPSSVFLPFGELMGGRQTSPKPSSADSDRRKILAETISCSSLGITTIRNCTGSIVMDTNVSSTATSLPAGSFISFRFDKIAGLIDGQSFTLDGSMRIDFLTAVSNLDNPGNNIKLQLGFDKFVGTGGGESFGPVTAIALLEVDALGQSSLTMNGVQYFELGQVSGSDSSNFSLGRSKLRAAHWSDSKSYVDYQFSNWQNSNGRPVQGSSATLMAGQDKAWITVDSSSIGQVSYRVQLSSGGVAKNYQVLASYSGSTVSYSVKAL